MKADGAASGDMRDEYSFAAGVRGKYAAQFAAGSNVVVLDPDVAELFADSASVNDALRALAAIASKQIKKARG